MSGNNGNAIAGRMSRLPVLPFHKKVTAIIGIGTFFDLFDIFLASTLGGVLGKQFHVSAGQLPLLIGSSFLGMFLGAILLSRMADKLGRRRAFMFTLLIYSLFTLLGAFATSPAMLIVFRFIAGLGIGAEPPLADVYLSEMLPGKVRGKFIAWAYTLGFIGVPAVGFLARGITPYQPLGVDGWRWLFVLGALGSVIVWFFRRGLPESPRWLETQGRHEEAEVLVAQLEKEAEAKFGKLAQPDAVSGEKPEKVKFGELFSKGYAGRTVMLYIFQIFQTFGYYGFGTLVPIVLAAKGYNTTSSLEYTALSFLGYPIGSLLSLPLVEKMDRKVLVVLGALGMGVFGLAFGSAGSSTAIIVLGFIYTLVSNIFSNSYHIYQSEIFPTAVRVTATGSAYSLSRLMSGLLPFILLPFLKSSGATAMFSVVSAAMVVIVITVLALGPKTKGRTLEQVSGRANISA